MNKISHTKSVPGHQSEGSYSVLTQKSHPNTLLFVCTRQISIVHGCFHKMGQHRDPRPTVPSKHRGWVFLRLEKVMKFHHHGPGSQRRETPMVWGRFCWSSFFPVGGLWKFEVGSWNPVYNIPKFAGLVNEMWEMMAGRGGDVHCHVYLVDMINVRESTYIQSALIHHTLFRMPMASCLQDPLQVDSSGTCLVVAKPFFSELRIT